MMLRHLEHIVLPPVSLVLHFHSSVSNQPHSAATSITAVPSPSICPDISPSLSSHRHPISSPSSTTFDSPHNAQVQVPPAVSRNQLTQQETSENKAHPKYSSSCIPPEPSESPTGLKRLHSPSLPPPV
ncbi:hypothetical protein BDW62DRAFT_166007 [Aspergillus aurantiobrunneus]